MSEEYRVHAAICAGNVTCASRMCDKCKQREVWNCREMVLVEPDAREKAQAEVQELQAELRSVMEENQRWYQTAVERDHYKAEAKRYRDAIQDAVTMLENTGCVPTGACVEAVEVLRDALNAGKE
jgi:mannose-1-phosphate guanylyltransferase